MPKDVWINRRRMAWLAIIVGLFVFPIAFLVFPELAALATAVYSLISAILVMYSGTALMYDKWQNSAKSEG